MESLSQIPLIAAINWNTVSGSSYTTFGFEGVRTHLAK